MHRTSPQQSHLDFIQFFSRIVPCTPAGVIHTWLVGLCTSRGVQRSQRSSNECFEFSTILSDWRKYETRKQIFVASWVLLNQFGSQHYSDSHQLNVINIIPTWLPKIFQTWLNKIFYDWNYFPTEFKWTTTTSSVSWQWSEDIHVLHIVFVRGGGGPEFIPHHKFSIWRRKPNRNYVSFQWII